MGWQDILGLEVMRSWVQFLIDFQVLMFKTVKSVRNKEHVSEAVAQAARGPVSSLEVVGSSLV